MSAISTPLDAGTAPRRRNGRQQACVPCRKRKVACDHKIPVCSRCIAGGIADTCVYSLQAAPESRPGNPLSKSSSRRISHQQPPPSSPAPAAFSPAVNDDGYLGVTSYKYAMSEAESKILSFKLSDAVPAQDQPPKARPAHSHMSDSRTYDTAMRILQAIPDKLFAYEMSRSYKNPNNGWCSLAVRWLHESLWIEFGDLLGEHRSTASLRDLGAILCENSSGPLREDYTDPKQWFSSFSGQNMRWEVLGILFTHWSFGAMAFLQGQEQHKYPLHDLNKDILLYKDCAWSIIEITRKMRSANTLLLYLTHVLGCLESIVVGDGSLEHLRIHGETMSLVAYLGLHVGGGEPQDRGICTQIKRRLFGKVFHCDKVISTYGGLPPMLSRRFISTLLPLDISDEVLLGVEPWKDGIVDDHGWNTVGKIYPSTLLRARLLMGFIRDSILTISLQTGGDVSGQELVNLLAKQEDTMSKLPSVLIFDPSDVDRQDVTGPMLYSRLLVRLEYLQNVFFIERLLNKVKNTTLSTALIQTSIDILSTTLVFWTHKDRTVGFHHDVEWLVMGFASPAAGILCLYLLQPFEGDAYGSLPIRNISRSEVIQKLSLLTGCLSWIRPLTPKKNVPTFVRGVVQRVLDEALNIPADSHTGMLNSIDWGDEMDIGLGDFNFDLLDTFKWLRPDDSY